MKKEGLDYYSPVQYLKAVKLFREGKSNIEVMKELFLSRKAVLSIKKIIKDSLSVKQVRQISK